MLLKNVYTYLIKATILLFLGIMPQTTCHWVWI